MSTQDDKPASPGGRTRRGMLGLLGAGSLFGLGLVAGSRCSRESIPGLAGTGPSPNPAASPPTAQDVARCQEAGHLLTTLPGASTPIYLAGGVEGLWQGTPTRPTFESFEWGVPIPHLETALAGVPTDMPQVPQVEDLFPPLEPGAWVGELGPGAGQFLPYWVRRVGPEGHVFMNDIDPNSCALMRYRAHVRCPEHAHTFIVRNTPMGCGFPVGRLRLVYAQAVHNLTTRWNGENLETSNARRLRFLRSLRDSLAPGGVHVVVDNYDYSKIPGHRFEDIKALLVAAGFASVDIRQKTPQLDMWTLIARREG